MPDVVADFAGDHRYLVEYLGEELLGELDADIAVVPAGCVVPRADLRAPVRRRAASAPVRRSLLEALQRSNLLVIPLDDRREWYRFHHLMSEFLQSELGRRDPDRRVDMHRRASEWCDAHGDADGAVTPRRARRRPRPGRVDGAALVRHASPPPAGGTRRPSAGWRCSRPRARRRPLLMVVAALGRFARGRAGTAVQWLARAAAALPERHPDDVHGPVAPGGSSPLARSIIAAAGAGGDGRRGHATSTSTSARRGAPAGVPRRGARRRSCSATSAEARRRLARGRRHARSTDPWSWRSASPTWPSSTSSTAAGRRRRPRGAPGQGAARRPGRRASRRSTSCSPSACSSRRTPTAGRRRRRPAAVPPAPHRAHRHCAVDQPAGAHRPRPRRPASPATAPRRRRCSTRPRRILATAPGAVARRRAAGRRPARGSRPATGRRASARRR